MEVSIICFFDPSYKNKNVNMYLNSDWKTNSSVRDPKNIATIDYHRSP